MSKKNLYLFEISDVLANQAKLPYSTGLIWSYCLEEKKISENYNLANWFWYKDEDNTVDAIFEKIENPSIIGLATFIWNWKWNKKICTRIKEKWPNCIIVIGGWQPPLADRSQKFFKENPCFDIIVHGEGEVTFKDILLENLKDKPDWSKIGGCSVKMELIGDKKEIEVPNIKEMTDVKGSNIIKNPSPLDTYVTKPRIRIPDLKCMPSPYLNGLFDKIILDCKYDLEATIETTRGCPFGCTFCEIGTKYYQKIKTHGNEKIFREIDWLANNKVVFVYNADSNFGILPEHMDIAKYLIKTKAETGYPDKHRVDWAKIQPTRVLEIAKLLYDAEMEPGITIALQSLNQNVLDAVKRKNMTDGKLEEVLNKYSEKQLKSYTELILGLPEETVDSFVEGVCKIIELGQHGYIGINDLIALPNTPFGDPEYRKKWGIKLVETLPSFVHVDNSDLRDETESMVVGTNTMTQEDYKEAQIYKWLILYGHYLGYFQYIARFLRIYKNVSYLSFYKKLLIFIKSNKDSFLKEEFDLTYKALNKVLIKQGPWGRVLDNVRKNFSWRFEEITAIRSAENKQRLYKEVTPFLEKFELEKDLLDDLINFQKNTIIDPYEKYPLNIETNYNIHELIVGSEKLVKQKNTYTVDGKMYNGNLYEWAKEIMWWGRKLGACKAKITNLKSLNLYNKKTSNYITRDL